MKDLSHEDLATGLSPDPDDLTRLLFFHGLESGPYGSKYNVLRKIDPGVMSPSFEGIVNVEDRVAIAESFTRGMKDLVVVGSSFGGLVAALLYDRYPERFQTYILLVPAFHFEEAQAISSMPEDAVVIHAEDDDIVPLEAVKNVCDRFTIPVEVVKDGHRLSGSLDLIEKRVREVLSVL
jgi:predicted esterase